MLTVDKLKEYGANSDEGLARCLGNESFYFKLIGMALDDANFSGLEKALSAGDIDAAFEEAHKLKGVLGNLSLTPMYQPVSELTEILRAKKSEGADELFAAVLEKRNELLDLMN